MPVAVDTNPLAVALAMVLLSINQREGRLVVGYTPSAQFAHAAGVVQGGAVGTMLDFAMVFLVMAALAPDMTMATAQLSISFQRAVLAGKVVTLNWSEVVRRRLLPALRCSTQTGSLSHQRRPSLQFSRNAPLQRSLWHERHRLLRPRYTCSKTRITKGIPEGLNGKTERCGLSRGATRWVRDSLEFGKPRALRSLPGERRD